MTVALCEESKRIDETRIDEVLETLAFFIGEAFLAAIGFWIGEIQFGVCDIEVAAENHWLAGLKLFAVGQERRIPMLKA
jgi:hypothetical protein